MSRYVAALVYRKKIGSMARKAILAYCAERANDDGSGVWASKVTISKEVECSKKTVIDTFNAFVSEGIVRIDGKRKISNGYVHIYSINLAAVEALENAICREELRGVILNPSPDVTPRGEAELPQEVKPLHPNRPRTVLKPSIPQTPKGDLFGSEKIAEKLKDDGPAFDEFWEAYPICQRKVGKAKAKKLFFSIINGKHKSIEKTDASVMLKGLKAWAASNPDPQYIPMPTTWLNDERWLAFLNIEGSRRANTRRAPDWEERVQ